MRPERVCSAIGSVEDLAGIEQAARIERALDLPHQLEAVVAHLLAQPRLLRQPDAVLAGDRAAERQRLARRSRRARGGRAAISSASRSSVRNVGCRLPSPMWPNVPICRSRARAVSAMNATMSASSLRGTVTSSRIVVGRRRASAENAFRRAAASASASASSRAARTSRAPCARGDRRHPRRFVRDRRRMAVGLHQQHRLAVGRQADVRVVLDAARRHAIEELERARE